MLLSLFQFYLKEIYLQVFLQQKKAVILQGYAYLKGFAIETIVTAVLFSMVGYLMVIIKRYGSWYKDLFKHFLYVYHFLTICQFNLMQI